MKARIITTIANTQHNENIGKNIKHIGFFHVTKHKEYFIYRHNFEILVSRINF